MCRDGMDLKKKTASGVGRRRCGNHDLRGLDYACWRSVRTFCGAEFALESTVVEAWARI